MSGIERLDRGIGPGLDLAEIDVGEHRPGEAQALPSRQAIEIGDDRDAAHDDRKLLLAVLGEVGRRHRNVRGGEIQFRLLKPHQAGERADRLIVDGPVRREEVAAVGARILVGLRPFGDDRRGEGRSGAADGLGLCDGAEGQRSGKHCRLGQSGRHAPHFADPGNVQSHHTVPLLQRARLARTCAHETIASYVFRSVVT